MSSENREKIIVRASLTGILANVLLSAGKAVIGFFSNSISVILDAVNNLSDVLSSVIAIAGTKLSLLPPDKEHPYGHGRGEYLSALIISVIVLYAGLSALVESIRKIIKPVVPEYKWSSVIFLFAAVFVKIFLGLYVKRAGKKVNSTTLVASGQDALMDSIVSSSTVVAALIFIFFGISLEAYLGLLISVLIIKNGVELVLETVSQILGERVDSRLAKDIKKTVRYCDKELLGAYDLTLNNYGPERYMGSVHVEVPDNWTVSKIDNVTRHIQETVFEKYGVILTAVGIYSSNANNKAATSMKQKVVHLLKHYPDILQIHGFYVDEVNKKISFDAVISFDSRDMNVCFESFKQSVQELFPEYKLSIHMDIDISD